MTVARFLFVLLTGRLLIWFLQTAGPVKPIRELNPFTRELFSCDFCLGVWVFTLLGIGQREASQPIFGYFHQALEVGVFAVICSFITHLGRLGWQSKFGITVYE